MNDGGATAAGCGGGGGGGGSEAQAANSHTAENTTSSLLSMIIPHRKFRNGNVAYPRTNISTSAPQPETLEDQTGSVVTRKSFSKLLNRWLLDAAAPPCASVTGS